MAGGRNKSELFGASPADAVFDEMVDLRREIHRQPELAFEEHLTTAMIRGHMAASEIPEALRTTDTGGIFAFDGGRPGRTVVLRGDIDVSAGPRGPVAPSHSDVEGLMHACGHDVHVGSMLGAASVLASRREDLPGRYIFLFQPGEEALCGAKAMVEGGALGHDGRPADRVPRDVGHTDRDVGACGRASRCPRRTRCGSRCTARAATPPYQRPGDVIRATADLVGRLSSVVEGLTYEGADCVCSAGTLKAGRRSTSSRRPPR